MISACYILLFLLNGEQLPFIGNAVAVDENESDDMRDKYLCNMRTKQKNPLTKMASNLDNL